MVSTLAYNPVLTVNAPGSFNISSSGYIQGQALDSPSIRNQLAGGVLASTETLPAWGGVAISEIISGVSGQPVSNLGGQIKRATNVTSNTTGSITGFSVFDQDHAMIQSPTSPVPVALSGMLVNFYRIGSGARLAVACDPALAAALQGGQINQQVSWDYVGQRLIPYSAAYSNTTITGAVWANTSGGQTTFTVGTDLTASINAGDDINVSGVVSTGGSGVGFNGAFVVVSVTSTTIVVTQALAASPGTYSSGGTVLAGGGLLNVEVLDFNIGNSMTVNYDTTTGFATWNRSGSCAVILI